MDVHTRDLRYFVAVAEELHFTRAAERLYLSQPALSKQIRRLEHNLGVELFDREGPGVRLTMAGAALLPHAEAVVAEWQRAEATVEGVRSAARATLVVGMSTSPGRGGLLPTIRSRFNNQHPEVTLTLRQVGWDDPTAGLADGRSDVAFVWLPLPAPERYDWTVLLHEPCDVAMSDQHPLADRDVIDFQELADEPFLALPRTAGPLREYWLATAHRRGRSPIVGAEISSTDETYEALVDGRGVCLLARGNAPSVAREGVAIRPVSGLPPCELALAWRIDRLRALGRDYVECARSAVDSTFSD
jgi:DNA-binding transcriptional LysR family regulator